MPKNIRLIAALSWTVFTTVLCLVSFGDLPTVNVSGVDKYVHATFHFVFVVLWYFYMADKNVAVVKTLARVVIMSLVFGILLEIAQGLFTATRQPDAKDVAANTAGALIAMFVLLAWNRFTQRDTAN